MTKSLHHALKRCAVWPFRTHARIAARWASIAYHLAQLADWGLPPKPEFQDHDIDLFYGWRAQRDPSWIERGARSQFALRGHDVLELSCGDGFYARHFYSACSRRVVACDPSPYAIQFARSRNSAPNIEYRVWDPNGELPSGPFGNIIWDLGWPFSRYLTSPQVTAIIQRVAAALDFDGIFTGHTQAGDLPKDRSDLNDLLLKAFTQVKVVEATVGRPLLYWQAKQS